MQYCKDFVCEMKAHDEVFSTWGYVLLTVSVSDLGFFFLFSEAEPTLRFYISSCKILRSI